MKSSKRLLAIAIALLLLFTAGCGSTDDAGGDHGSTDAAKTATSAASAEE